MTVESSKYSELTLPTYGNFNKLIDIDVIPMRDLNGIITNFVINVMNEGKSCMTILLKYNVVPLYQYERTSTTGGKVDTFSEDEYPFIIPIKTISRKGYLTTNKATYNIEVDVEGLYSINILFNRCCSGGTFVMRYGIVSTNKTRQYVLAEKIYHLSPKVEWKAHTIYYY